VIVLLVNVAHRLCKSYLASLVVPILWVANSALAGPLTWTCAYNEILCSGIFLLAFYAFLLYVETENWRYNALQWAAFVIGFGILEINVVYPLIPILYAACFARKFIRSAALLLIPSVVFTFIFFATRITPRNESFYALNAGVSMLKTFVGYWGIALGPSAAAEYFLRVQSFAAPITAVLSLAILLFVAWRTSRGDRTPFFCLGWFVIALAPFLPIYSHLTDYYVTVPAIGLALLGGWAMTVSFRSKLVYRIAALSAIAVYLALQIPTARAASKLLWARSMPVKRLVLSVQNVYQRNPGKIILLDGVDEPLFWLGVYNQPFGLFGANDVYLTPANARKITPHPELANIEDYTLPEGQMNSALSQKSALVYAVEDGKIRDITGIFQVAVLNAAVPRRIELGHPPIESLLGTSWYGSEGDFRWMPKEATVRLGVPESGQGEIIVEAFCAPVQVATQAIVAWVTVDGQAGPKSIVRDCNQPVMLRASFRVPPGTKEVEAAIQVDHTMRIGADQRDLGLAVRSIEVVSKP
jgi:hypothetical protein